MGRRAGVHWWDRLPSPVTEGALTFWARVPRRLQLALVPLSHIVNPGHTVSGTPQPGASTVPGVDAIRAEGFTPIEELTGLVEVALQWPPRDRRAVPETREAWLDESLEGSAWLVRTPWPAIPLNDVLPLLWSEIDDMPSHRERLAAAHDVLRWPADRAEARLAARRTGPR